MYCIEKAAPTLASMHETQIVEGNDEEDDEPIDSPPPSDSEPSTPPTSDDERGLDTPTESDTEDELSTPPESVFTGQPSEFDGVNLLKIVFI